jgi:hypothetical protein
MTEVIGIDTRNKRGIKASKRLSTYVRSAYETVVTYRDAHPNDYALDFFKLHTVRIDEHGTPYGVSPVKGGKKPKRVNKK